MSCNFDKEQLRRYLLGLDDPAAAQATSEHVAKCPACKNELQHLQLTADILTSAFDEEPPDWLMQKTLARVREKQQKKISWRTWGIPAMAGIAVTVLLMVLYPGTRKNLSPSFRAGPAEQNAGTLSNRQETNDASDYLSSLFGIISDETDVDMISPVDDRSIYESLDIAPEVVPLLL
jgi:anti-sigma factor RsiW